MSNLIHTKIPPFHEDQPIDVGQVNLLNNNVQNLIQYWQNPLYFMSWYGGAVRPVAVLATDYQELEFISYLGCNMVRLTPWGIENSVQYASGVLWGAFKAVTTVKGDFILHLNTYGVKLVSIPFTLSVANVPEWIRIPETSFGSIHQKPEQFTVSISNTDNAATVTLHDVCIYGRPS